MSNDQEQRRPQQDPRSQRENRIFVVVAGCMMVAALTFGVLNSLNIIHM